MAEKGLREDEERLGIRSMESIRPPVVDARDALMRVNSRTRRVMRRSCACVRVLEGSRLVVLVVGGRRRSDLLARMRRRVGGSEGWVIWRVQRVVRIGIRSLWCDGGCW